MAKKVMVIGLDCGAPKLFFEQFRDQLPNLKKIMENGAYGRMRTTEPPITIPAWMVMMTSVNPGSMGIYGFRHRTLNSYTDFWIANSFKMTKPKLWEILGEKGMDSIVVGVPPTFPIKPMKGHMISGFITPGIENDYTHPLSLKQEIADLVGEYILDITFRTENKQQLVDELFEMTKKRHEVIKYLIKNKPWQFFMFVEIGLDRLHHGFWKYFDKEHHLYEPGNQFENVFLEYYKLLDKQVGEIMELVDDETAILVVSDHGAKRMKGCFCINEWLIKQGYLVLNNYPEDITRPGKADINWEKTKAWGWGGYYSRVFLNMQGREETGVIPQEDYDKEMNILKEKLLSIKGPNGEEWKNMVYRPEERYPETNGDPPDLMVYFDDLSWRSAGTMGHNKMYLPENDMGPDDAVHDWYGIFMLYDPKKKIGKKLPDLSIMDVAPTVMDLLGQEVPPQMEGKIIRP